MGRPTTFAVAMVRFPEMVALMTLALYTDTLPVPQSGSVTRSYWYQTTDTEPGPPACTHGHSTVVPGCATVIGVDQLCPWSVDQAKWIELAAGVAALTGLGWPGT